MIQRSVQTCLIAAAALLAMRLDAATTRVHLENKSGAAWTLKASDPADSSKPAFKLQGYVMKDGKEEMETMATLGGSSKQVASGEWTLHPENEGDKARGSYFLLIESTGPKVFSLSLKAKNGISNEMKFALNDLTGSYELQHSRFAKDGGQQAVEVKKATNGKDDVVTVEHTAPGEFAPYQVQVSIHKKEYTLK